MRNRLKCEDVQVIARKRNVPPVGGYENALGVNGRGEYNIQSEWVNNKAVYWGKDQDRFYYWKDENGNPGPGDHQTIGEITQPKQFVSYYPTSKVSSFSNLEKFHIPFPNKNPGPGQYRLPSDFGYIDIVRNPNKKLPKTKLSVPQSIDDSILSSKQSKRTQKKDQLQEIQRVFAETARHFSTPQRAATAERYRVTHIRSKNGGSTNLVHVFGVPKSSVKVFGKPTNFLKRKFSQGHSRQKQFVLSATKATTIKQDLKKALLSEQLQIESISKSIKKAAHT